MYFSESMPCIICIQQNADAGFVLPVHTTLSQLYVRHDNL